MFLWCSSPVSLVRNSAVPWHLQSWKPTRGSFELRRSQYDRNYRAMIFLRFSALQLFAKLAHHGVHAMDQQKTDQSRQDPPIDVSQGSEKPARRKKNTKSTRRTQPDLQPPAAKSKAEVPTAEEIVATPPPPVTDNISEPATDAARPNFIADPEPVTHGRGFLCKFTLSRPGLVGLNKLAIYLNDLQDSGSISGWQASGWDDPATRVRALIGFATRADAITAIKSVP